MTDLQKQKTSHKRGTRLDLLLFLHGSSDFRLLLVTVVVLVRPVGSLVLALLVGRSFFEDFSVLS